jgi:hypothetical protein
LADYRLLRAAGLPAIKIGHLHAPATATRYDMKGMRKAVRSLRPRRSSTQFATRWPPSAPRWSGGAEVNETLITPRRLLAAMRKAGKVPAIE